MLSELPDRYHDALIFAYREASQKSLGFVPFELLYGRSTLRISSDFAINLDEISILVVGLILAHRFEHGLKSAVESFNQSITLWVIELLLVVSVITGDPLPSLVN